MGRPAPQQLLELLEVMTEEYSELRTILEEKQEVLLERDVDRLETITRQEECLVQELQGLDSDREQLLDRILPADESPAETPLSRLMKYFPEPIRPKLDERRTQLKTTVRDVQKLNDQNMFLLENRVSVYDRIFNMITGKDENNKTYDRDRQARPASSTEARLVDEAI